MYKTAFLIGVVNINMKYICILRCRCKAIL